MNGNIRSSGRASARHIASEIKTCLGYGLKVSGGGYLIESSTAHAQQIIRQGLGFRFTNWVTI